MYNGGFCSNCLFADLSNGSPRPKGNASIAPREMEHIFQTEGVETEIIQVENRDIRGCVACNGMIGTPSLNDHVTPSPAVPEANTSPSGPPEGSGVGVGVGVGFGMAK